MIQKLLEKKLKKLLFNLTESDIRTKVLEVVKLAKETVDIAEATVIVAGGRGVGSKENFEKLKELAEVLDGTVAASRAAIEKEWVDKDLQVGQTGKTVRPELYIALWYFRSNSAFSWNAGSVII